jgi:hypothetical protein
MHRNLRGKHVVHSLSQTRTEFEDDYGNISRGGLRTPFEVDQGSQGQNQHVVAGESFCSASH